MMTIENLFQRLEVSLSAEDYEHADLILAKLSRYSDRFDDRHIEEYDYAQRIVEIELHGISDLFYDGDDDLFDWDGDALASAGFGVDEDY